MPTTTDLTYTVSRMIRSGRTYWMLTSQYDDFTSSLGPVDEFADDLAVKLAAEPIIRERTHAAHLRITAGPVWSPMNSARTGYRADLTVVPWLNQYQVDRAAPIEAARAIVTDGGALVFIDAEGQATQGFSPGSWASFRMLPSA